MIDLQSINIEWINKVSKANRNADKILVEKVICAEDFISIKKIAIEGKTVRYGDIELNLGEECSLENGNYPVKSIVRD